MQECCLLICNRQHDYFPVNTRSVTYIKMKKLAVLTGSGISAESGLSTFRDAGGLWDQYPIEDVATPEGWFRNPALVLDFYNQRRRQLLDVKPNAAHLGLAELEQYFQVTIITQNVDNLHEAAGSSDIVHLHGELMKVRSTGPDEKVYTLKDPSESIGLGDKSPDGYQLRPHIVWFGEAVPEIERAAEIVSDCDIMAIIGTSLQVYPAAGLIAYAKTDVPVYLIDPNDVPVSPGRVTIIKARASEGIIKLKELLLQER